MWLLSRSLSTLGFLSLFTLLWFACTPPATSEDCADCKGHCLVQTDGSRTCAECKPGATRACQDSTSGACGKASQTCSDRGSWETCSSPGNCKSGEVCKDGQCSNPCASLTNTCTKVGERQCVASPDSKAGHYKVCETNSAGCLVWSPEKSCPAGEACQQGQCQTSQCPPPACKVGEKRCSRGQAQSCEKNAKGCLDWGTPSACPKDQICHDGTGCAVCKPGSQKECYSGASGTKDVGLCKGGKQTCKGDGSGYEPCKGEVTPSQPTCNGKDNNCDGAVDCPDPAPALAFLRKGVTSIGVPGVPGTLIAFGGKSFPVVQANAGGQKEPVAVAAFVGKGRLMAFGHGGYLSSSLMSRADTGRFLQQVVRWLAGQNSTTVAAPKVLLLGGLSLGNYLKAQKFPATVQASNTLPANYKDYKVMVIRDAVLGSAAVRKKVTDWLKQGGGVLIADTPWGWAQINRKNIITEMPSNLFLTPLGLAWTGNLISGGQSTLSVATAPSPLLHGIQAQELLVKQAAGQSKPSTADVKLASHTLLQIGRWLHPGDKLFLPGLTALLSKNSSKLVPSAKNPIKDTDGLLRALMALQLEQSKRLPPQQVKAHPAAATFPGSVPKTASRVKVSLSINTATPRWHSTGLYAAAGEVITLTLPASATGAKLYVRIGAHKDQLWGKDKWRRVPEISRRWALTKTSTQVASAFGGLLYIEVPSGSKAGVVKVEVQGAVRAPLYVHGRTSLQDWKNTIRSHPAPWAELASSKLILTVPSSVVRSLDDPDKLMGHWDKVMDAAADLAVVSRTRKSPERVVMDEQISAGYMHAGYPIMTHLDVRTALTRYANISQKGGWGIYHEIGHNHQSRYWTFGGTTEVTVNLFTLYIFHTIHNNQKPRTNLYGTARTQKIAAYIKAGAKFSTWQKDPFLALLMYMQLQEAFGWKAYKQVFDGYHKSPSAQLPKNDAEERDQWMVRFSQHIQKNLGPFFQAWGIPTSAAARKSISSLPTWMPAGFPPKP